MRKSNTSVSALLKKASRPVADHFLVLINAQQALERAKSLSDIKEIRDKAETARNYAQVARLGLNFINTASEIKLRAERRAGSLLAQLYLRGGDRKSNDKSVRIKLSDLHISEHESRRWQREAKIPETIFLEYLRIATESGQMITRSGLHRYAGKSTFTASTIQFRKAKVGGSPALVPESHLNGTDGDSNVRGLLDEATNHLDTIASIGTTVVKNGQFTSEASRQMAFLRYVRELRGILSDLRRELL